MKGNKLMRKVRLPGLPKTTVRAHADSGSDMGESHYDVLGVDGRTASTEEIKRAYKSLALALHPDKQGGSVDGFVRVQRAWEARLPPDIVIICLPNPTATTDNAADAVSHELVQYYFLSDPEERRAYDSALTARRTDVVISDEIHLDEMDEADEIESPGEENENARESAPEPEPGSGSRSRIDASADERTSTGIDGSTRNGSAPMPYRKRYTYPCRCGDCYEVLSSELHPDFDDVDVPCASCSLYVRVKYGGQL